MIYHETSKSIIVRREDESPQSFDEFHSLLLEEVTDLMGFAYYPSCGGNDYAYHYFAAITGCERVMAIYHVDEADYRRFVDGKYVVLPMVRETSWDEVETTEFAEGLAD